MNAAVATLDRADADRVLDAFDRGSALIALDARRLRWCSPAFASALGAAPGQSLDAIEPRLPGLAEAIDLSRGDAAVHRWTVPLPPAQWREAQLVRLSPREAALRLVDPGEQGLAMQRHLADREQMLFTSRAVSVGEMASTLAHELNQPIGAVANVLRGIQSRLATPGIDAAVLGKGVQLALDQALYAARIIARIRDYTLSRQPQREPIELGQVVRDAIALLDWELQRRSVTLELDLAAAPCRLRGDEVMLQQLLVNLLRNAIEAMGEAAPSERRLGVRLLREGREAQLLLRDTGCGLPPDGEARLFAPFQSTKPNGMGIGLNICRSFVELHQGRLWFSRPAAGPGSIFHVVLPLDPSLTETP